MALPLAGSDNCIPREAAARKLKETVLVGEIYVDRLYKLPLRKPVARDLSRFQPVRRDFSLIVNQNVSWDTIDRALASTAIPELIDWRVREVFRDARLGPQDYSLLLGVTFQAPDRTLRDEELQSLQERIVRSGRFRRRSPAYVDRRKSASKGVGTSPARFSRRKSTTTQRYPCAVP